MSESKQLDDAPQNAFFEETVDTRDPAIDKVIGMEMSRQQN